VNILFLDQFSEMGGAQQCLLDTADAARQRSWNLWAAIPPAGPLSGELQSLGVSVAQIPCGPYRSQTKRTTDLFRFVSDARRQAHAIRGLMEQVQFDLMYVNGPRLLPAVALSSNCRVPVLFHSHNHLGQTSARSLARWSIRRSRAAVVACSRSVMNQFRGSADSHKQFIVPNGVRECSSRHRDFPRDGKWRIGVIGRISPEKGQAEFVGAAARLHAGFPAARFVVCGAPMFGDARYFEQVHRLARGLPIDFPGWREDVSTVLSELDLLVVPSKQEGMGRVLIEAYSAGVPVVAFAVGGVPEVVTDDRTGFLVHERTAEALAERIGEIMRSDAAHLHRIAANARRAWENRYSLQIYQQRITELMERLALHHPIESEINSPLRREGGARNI
jgi:glycosyltransferase involved in cell wall biosynthesis